LEGAAPRMEDLAAELTPVVEDRALASAGGIPGFVDGLIDMEGELPVVIQFMKDLADARERLGEFLINLAVREQIGPGAVNDFLTGEDFTGWWEEMFAMDPAVTHGFEEEMKASGANAGQGLANGLKSKEAEVRNASLLLANTSKYAVANALRVQSPSKV